MCIVIICCPVCDVMNFEINFLIKWLFNITKKSDKNMNISRMKRAFNMKSKAFFITFKGLSAVKNCLESDLKIDPIESL